MRARDLELGMRYATCDGALVVPVSLDRVWARVYTENKYKIVNVGSVKVDPWGGCTAAGRRLPKGITPNDIGIKCEKFTPDRDGDPIEERGEEVVINPRDIKGLWPEYMVLHGEIVRRAADRRTWSALQRELTQEFHAALRSAIPGVTTSVALNEVYNGSVEPVREQLRGGELRVSFASREEWDQVITALYALGGDLGDSGARVREMLPPKSDQDAE